MKATVARMKELAIRAYVSVFLFDPARPVEMLSLIGMLGWCWFLFFHPEAFERPGYVTFNILGAHGWAIIMVMVAGAQVAALFKPTGHFWHEIRFAAMAAAAGVWSAVAVHFWANESISTADTTYTAIAIVTALTGIYLGWKSTSYSSP